MVHKGAVQHWKACWYVDTTYPAEYAIDWADCRRVLHARVTIINNVFRDRHHSRGTVALLLSLLQLSLLQLSLLHLSLLIL